MIRKTIRLKAGDSLKIETPNGIIHIDAGKFERDTNFPMDLVEITSNGKRADMLNPAINESTRWPNDVTLNRLIKVDLATYQALGYED